MASTILRRAAIIAGIKPLPPPTSIASLLYSLSMNLRHALALALVGWYLMVPYEGGKGPHFGDWTVIATFAGYQSCQRAASDLRSDAYGSSAIDRSDRSSGKDRALEIWQKENATCE